MFRMLHLGEPSPEIDNYAKIIIENLQATPAAIKTGNICEQVKGVWRSNTISKQLFCWAERVLEAILKHSARIRNMGRFKAKSEPFRLRFAFCHYSLGKSFIMSVQTRLLQSYS